MTDLDAATFAAEVRAAGADLDPVRANLLLAREIAYPRLRPSEALAQLAALTEAAAGVVGLSGPVGERAAGLARFLYAEAGFRGNQADYPDPRNSYLNDVLQRRLGIPISLATIYLAVARGLGLDTFGVGLPGHFLAGVAAAGRPILVDAFGGEAGLEPEACLQLVRRATGYMGPFDPRWIRPAGGPEIVARMLNNLRNSYTQTEDWLAAIRVVERLAELQPDEASHQRDLGMLSFKAGAHPQAVRYLGEYLARAPEAADAAAVRQSRNLLLAEIARLN